MDPRGSRGDESFAMPGPGDAGVLSSAMIRRVPSPPSGLATIQSEAHEDFMWEAGEIVKKT
jgi:hypothetical protein